MYKLPVHPYVVRLLDHFENKEFIYLVLDKHPGNNLEEYLEENRNELKEKDFQIYATQIGNAIDYLHDDRILLRNLNMNSIIMTDISITKA